MWIRSKSPLPDRLRVMTVNVHKGFALLNRRSVLHDVRDAVREVGADLVFLQETRSAYMARHQRSDMHRYEYLVGQIWPGYANACNALHAIGRHGNALLSKYPIVRSENVDVSVAEREKHGLLHCALRLPGRANIVHAICVHLGLKQSHRQRQLLHLCDFVRHYVPHSEPLLVAGDFNDWRGHAHAALRECADLGEVFVEAHGVAARTFPARLPLLRLDRIYVRSVRDHSPLALPARPWSDLSDHVPIAAEIRL